MIIKQCKGKMLDAVPESRILGGLYLVQTKYDGTMFRYIRLVKILVSILVVVSNSI